MQNMKTFYWYVWGATIGKCALVPDMEEFSLARSVALIKPKPDLVNSKYLLHLFNTEFIQRQLVKRSNSSAQAGLYTRQIKQIEVVLPDIKDQEEFALVAEKIHVLKEKLNVSLDELKDLYGSLSQRAFNGQLDLNKIDLMHEEEYSSSDNDRTELHHFEKPIDKQSIEIKKPKNDDEANKIEEYNDSESQLYPPMLKVKMEDSKPLQSTGELLPNIANIAEIVKNDFKDKYFTSEMLIQFVEKKYGNSKPQYATSKEIKENRKLDLSRDLKEIIFQAINEDNEFLKLEQVFYNGEKENFVLKVRKEDYDLIKNKSAKERSGIYLKLKE